MISAGQYGPQGPQGYPPQGGYPPQQGYGYPQQGPGIGSYVPNTAPAAYNGMPNITANMELGATDGKEILGKQMLWGGINTSASQVNQTLNQVFNYMLANKSLSVQEAVATKYYQTQDNIAQAQKEVALTQLAVQEEAIFAQEEMHGNQIRHEEKMARLEGATQARLAAISEAGKNRRAEILSMTDAFGRNGWDMGSPLCA